MNIKSTGWFHVDLISSSTSVDVLRKTLARQEIEAREQTAVISGQCSSVPTRSCLTETSSHRLATDNRNRVSTQQKFQAFLSHLDRHEKCTASISA